MRTILSRALAELNAHRSVVLVTIVAEQGSAPRVPSPAPVRTWRITSS